MYGLERIPHNSLMVICGDEVVVIAACNDVATDGIAAVVDITATDGVTVAVGAVTAFVVWVQRC